MIRAVNKTLDFSPLKDSQYPLPNNIYLQVYLFPYRRPSSPTGKLYGFSTQDFTYYRPIGPSAVGALPLPQPMAGARYISN